MQPRSILLIVLAVLLLAFVGAVYTGYVTFHTDDEGVVVGDATLSIPADELQQCCTFLDDSGTRKRCAVIAPYDCSYCEEYC